MLTTSSITYYYAGSSSPAINDISFEVASSGVVGLVGSNGSGKSTLLKMLAGILTPSTGTISLSGLPPASREAKQNTLLLTGNENLPDFLTGLELIKFYSSLYHQPVDSQKLDDLLQRYQLSGQISSLIEDYSHGMKKKLQFICALLMSRDLTILDETLNGVDFQSLRLANEDLSNLSRDKIVILCTHDNFLTEDLADRYLGLKDGRLLRDVTYTEMSNQYGSLTSLLENLVEEGNR